MTLARIAGGIHDRNAVMPGASHQPVGAEGRTELAHLEPEAAAELQRLLWGRRFSAGADDESLTTAWRLPRGERRRGSD